MSGPGWPGQTPGQQQMQRMRQQARRQQEMAWWAEQQKTGVVPPADRLGCVGRLVRGVLSLVLGLAWLLTLVAAGYLAFSEQLNAAVVVAVAALVIYGFATAIGRWGRG